MLDDAELNRMSPENRARLARALSILDEPHPLDDPEFRRGRRLWLALTVGACVVLAAWIGILAVTLPQHFTAAHWRGAWVGFDIALLVAFAVTAWSAWRRRQLLIVCLIVTATLLCCDAWFDLTLDLGAPTFAWSLLSAALVELPVAALMIIGARRLLLLTVRVAMARGGLTGAAPPLWRMTLFGPDPADRPSAVPAGEATGDQAERRAG